MTAAQKGTVYLVGAGPGDPELLTIRALKLLQSADIVLHDDLVSQQIIEQCNRHALVSSVGKRCGQPRITQAGIHELMVDSARRQLSVVRLKSGDPMVFGRAAEELAALRSAGIPAEVVPGVSAAFAASAALQVPLTDRHTASKLILMTGSHAETKESLAGLQAWQGHLPVDATLAIYMPGRNLATLCENLRLAGLPDDIPCVAISSAATVHQQAKSAPLSSFANIQPGPSPLLVLVGRAMQPVLNESKERVHSDGDQRLPSSGSLLTNENAEC